MWQLFFRRLSWLSWFVYQSARFPLLCLIAVAHKIALTKAHLIAYKMAMPPPIIHLRFAKYLGVHEQTVSKFNTMASRPGLKIACKLAKIARDLGQTEVTILDWRPDLLDKEVWPEIVRAVRSAKLYKSDK